MKIRAFGRSVVGKVRTRNEDTLAVVPSRGLVVVADGMGGAPRGEVASALAVQEVVRGLQEGQGIAEAVQRANGRIRRMVEAQPVLEGMGTTLTVLRVLSGEGRFEIGHVGDSRAYRLAADGFGPLTRDHTLVREMVEEGKVPPEAERGHPLAHVLSRAVGTEASVEVEVVEGPLTSGDRFLLCSDGLMKVMEDAELEVWVRAVEDQPLEEVVEGIVEEGMRRGAPDNITVALLVVRAPTPSPG